MIRFEQGNRWFEQTAAFSDEWAVEIAQRRQDCVMIRFEQGNRWFEQTAAFCDEWAVKIVHRRRRAVT